MTYTAVSQDAGANRVPKADQAGLISPAWLFGGQGLNVVPTNDEVTCPNNATTEVTAFDVTDTSGLMLWYWVERNGKRRVGVLHVAGHASAPTISDTAADAGTSGVSFTVTLASTTASVNAVVTNATDAAIVRFIGFSLAKPT